MEASIVLHDGGPAWTKLERNLERWPMFPLDKKNRVRQIEYRDDHDREWIVSTPRAALPGPFANDLWLAICKLYNDDRSSPPSRKIRTTLAGLTRILDIEKGGTTWRTMREVLEHDFMAVQFKTKNTFRQKGGTVRKTELFHLVEHVTWEESDSNPEVVIEITLSPEIAASLESGFFRLLDMVTYRALSSPTAKRLFRYLDQRRRRGSETLMAMDVPLPELRERLPLTPTSPSLVQRTLNRAHKELIQQGVLELAQHMKTGEGDRIDNWIVRYRFPDAKQETLALEEGDDGDTTVRQIDSESDYLRSKVEELLAFFGDEKSSAFYTLVVKSLAPEMLDHIFADVRSEVRLGKLNIQAARKIFTATAMKRMSASERSSSRTSALRRVGS